MFTGLCLFRRVRKIEKLVPLTLVTNFRRADDACNDLNNLALQAIFLVT